MAQNHKSSSTYGYPSDETGKVGYYDKDGNVLFVLTCKTFGGEFYFLYEAQPDGSLKRIDKSKDPQALIARHHVEEKMRGETEQCKPTRARAEETGTTSVTKRSAARASAARSRRTT